MAASTLQVDEWCAERGLEPDDEYADTVDKLRIVFDPIDASRPWSVDGFNTKTGQYSMWSHTYATFDSAVADLRLLWIEYIVEPARLDNESEGDDAEG